MNPLLGLIDKPPGISFIDQEPDEKIELLIRKHWITWLPWMMLSLLGLLTPVGAVAALQSAHLNFQDLKESQLMIGVFLWYLLVFSFAFENFLYWYYNAYIITTKHMVFVNFHGIYNRDITERHYDDIQSVSSHVSGITTSFLKIGSVSIEMIGEDTEITLDQIPSPEQVAERIEDVKDGSGGGG